MAAELGHFALILAFCLTLPQTFFGLAGAHYRRPHWMAIASRAVAGQFVFTACAFGCLAYAFNQNDFSVLYVASNSNSALPAFYRFAAVWGAHEGSLLLWMLVLATWSIAVLAFGQQRPDTMTARVLGVLGILSLGFGLFILMTSSPFERLWPAAVDGRDLNPVLQDPALAIHPPTLYMGYVGLSVSFAFAAAAMLEGKLDAAWARYVRPWTITAWMFLTCGIALGSWWAYYELGWGGWWFWDSVENASFMPWLAATALIHSLAVSEKRGIFKSWTLLLAITGFSLSLLGTFLVRSGVIESVHAFASDPGRGLFILVFLGVCVGGSLVLYAVRASKFKNDSGFMPGSREAFLLYNNILLTAALGVVLVGTLYPMFIDALNLPKVSVGAPYFDFVFPMPMLPLVLLLGIGMHATWKRTSFERVRTWLVGAAIGAVALTLIVSLAIYEWHSVMTVVGLITAFWVVLSSLIEPIERVRKGHTLSASVLGMCVAHLGVGLFILGVTSVKSYQHDADLSLKPGESKALGGYDFKLVSLRNVQGPNYAAVESEIEISRNGKLVTRMHPQERQYRVQQSTMTELGIEAGWGRDLLVGMGQPLGNDTWSFRLHYKPMVRFIWFGCATMALGGLIAICDRRHRQKVTADEPVGAKVPAKA